MRAAEEVMIDEIEEAHVGSPSKGKRVEQSVSRLVLPLGLYPLLGVLSRRS